MADTPLTRWTMNQLLDAYPGAAEVLAAHGVDPRTRCNHAVREYLKLGSVLGRNCPVDDVAATLADLEAFMHRQGSPDTRCRSSSGSNASTPE